MISSCIIVLLLLLIIILLMIKNRKCRVSNYLEHFYLNDNDTKINGTSSECKNNDNQDVSCSSNLIGKDGVLQTLPHCNDIPYKNYPLRGDKEDIKNHTFPNCCDDESFETRKCNRLFPRNPVLVMAGDKWVKAGASYRDDSKFIYNPIFPYSRKGIGFLDRPNPLTRLANKSVSRITNNEGSINNIGRIGPTTIPGRDKTTQTTINDNNMNILKDYAKDLTLGKDKNKKICTLSNPENCESMGTNRWEKIGKCSGTQSDKWSYVDVKNSNKGHIFKGLIPNIGYDFLKILSFDKGFGGSHDCDEQRQGLHYASGLTDDIS